MAQQHNPKIATDGLIYHLDTTNGGKGGSKIITKPTQVDGCVLWLDADDKEAIVESSGAVSTWLDKSGNGNHASQSTGTKQPAYSDNGMNGRGIITFDASTYDTLNAGDSSTIDVAGSITIITASRIADDIASGSDINTVHKDNQYSCRIQDVENGTITWADSQSWSYANFGFHSAGLYPSKTAIVTQMRDSSIATECSGYVNGKQVYNKSHGSGDITTTGYDCYIGSYNNGGGWWDGQINEVLIYNRALSDTERQSIEYYLSRKWAIPLKGKVTTNLADGVNTTISDSGPVEVTHNNTFYFPNSDDDNCDIRLEGNEITIADNLAWTIEFWVKRHTRYVSAASGGGYHGIWGNLLTTNEHERLQFTASASEDKLILVDDGDNNSAATITNCADIDCLHKWRHVVLAFDGTTDATTAGCLRQYVDGQDKGSDIALRNADSKITIKRIGSRGSSGDSHRLEGELGNFRVYDKQLSHAEVLQNYNAQQAKYQNKKMSFAAPGNLLVYWDAQSGTSSNYYANGTWYDISGGTAYNGTRSNATFTDEGVKYYDFDGTGDYFTTTVDWSANGNRTFACWLRLDDISSSRAIFDTSNQGDFSVQTDGQVRSHPVASNWNDTASSLVVNVWYYIVLTQSSTARKIYFDGTEQSLTVGGGSPQTVAWNNPTSDMRLGHGGSYRSDLNGQMANVMVYNIELSADQIMQNYNYFKHRFGK